MLPVMQQYKSAVTGLLDRVLSTQETTISKAARAIIDTQKRNGRVWIIGPGVHSYIGLEEMCFRSGGIFNIYPMECSMLSMGGVKPWTATMMERTEGLALSIFKASGVEENDCVIIYNQYGINPVAIESALVSKAMGIPSIGITSSEFCKLVPNDHPARHSSGHNLHEIVDIHINTWVPGEDAVVEVDGLDTRICAVSTLVGAFAAQCLVARTVELAVKESFPIRLARCGNTPGGDAYNLQNMIELGDELGTGGGKGRRTRYPSADEIRRLAGPQE